MIADSTEGRIVSNMKEILPQLEELYAEGLSESRNPYRAGDIVIAATGWRKDGKLVHPRKDNFIDFDHGYALIMAGENQYNAEIVVGITDRGEYVFYDVTNITPDSFKLKEEPLTTATTEKPIGDIQRDSSGGRVAQELGEVKRKLSDRENSYTSEDIQRMEDELYDVSVRLSDAESRYNSLLNNNDLVRAEKRMKEIRDNSISRIEAIRSPEYKAARAERDAIKERLNIEAEKEAYFDLKDQKDRGCLQGRKDGFHRGQDCFQHEGDSSSAGGTVRRSSE